MSQPATIVILCGVAIQQLGLGITLSGKDQISSLLAGVGANLGSLQGKTAKFAKAMKVGFAAVGVSIGLMAGIGALAAPFGRFEQGIAKVGAISQASEEDLARLAAAAKEAGIKTQFSPEEAVQGLANLAQAGFDATDSIKLLTPVLDFAAGGQIDLAQSSATVAAAIKAFSLEGKDAAIVADKLLKISNLTALKAGDLELALGNVARGAGATQQSLDQMLPAIGLVRDTGVDASVAASSVSSALLFMAKNAKAFKAVGVEVTDAQGNFRPFLNIVEETSRALATKYPNAADRAAQMTELFGRFGLTAANAIGNQLAKGIKVAGVEGLKGADAINALTGAMANAEGTAAKFTEALLDTFEGQKTLLKGSIETLAIVAGEPFAKALKPMVGQVISSVNALIAWFDKLDPSTKKTIASVVMGAVAFIGIAGAIIAAVGAIGFLVTALGGSTLAWLGVGTVAAGAGAAITSSVDDSEKATESLRSALNGVKVIVDQVWGAVEAFFSGLKAGWNAAITEAQPAIDQFWIALEDIGKALDDVGINFDDAGSIGRTLGHILGKIAEYAIMAGTWLIIFGADLVDAWNEAESVISPVTDAISNLLDEIDVAISDVGELGTEADGSSGAWGELANAIVVVASVLGAVLGPVIKIIGRIISSLVWIFGGVINIIYGYVTGDWSRVWLGIKEVVFGAVKGIVAIVFGLAEAVAGMIDSLYKAMGKPAPAGGLAKGVKELQANIQTELKKGLGVQVKVKPEVEKPAEFGAFSLATFGDVSAFQAPAGFRGGLPTPTITAVSGGAAPDTGAITSAATAAAVAAARAAPARLVGKATLVVDGQVLGEIVNQWDRDGSERAAVEVTAG